MISGSEVSGSVRNYRVGDTCRGIRMSTDWTAAGQGGTSLHEGPEVSQGGKQLQTATDDEAQLLNLSIWASKYEFAC